VIPRDLSLVSFDNHYNQSMYPITAVDQNFGELGYKSAHIFIKDIVVQADKTGRIVSNPKLIDRRSLGLARPQDRSVSAAADSIAISKKPRLK
jgi:DNA-binding LacI/PurR family transcriptional regulator